MKKIVLFQVVIAVAVLVTSDAYGDSQSDYWPTWRGPNCMGISPKGNPPATWSETENIKWKVKLPGQSTSSPVVWADKILFQTAIETDKKGTPSAEAGSESGDADRSRRQPFHGGRPPKNVYKFDLVCLSRKTGKLLWQKTAREELPHEGHHPTHGFASYSPVTDGKHVWASFGSRGVHCYNMDGNHKWGRDLGIMRKLISFGEGSSPALADNAVIVVMDHEGDSVIYALNKNTGETIWKKARDEGSSWATPLPVEVNGKMQVVTSATNFARSYDVKTGDLIFKCSGQVSNVISTPVVGFGMVFCTSGRRGSSLQAIELGRTGDLSNTDAVKWHVKEATPYVPSPLLYGDKLYVCSVNQRIISCYNARTGKAYFFKERLKEINGIYASPAAAAGRVYFVGRNGVTYVLKSSEQFQVLAVNKLDDKFDCSAAFVGDEIFLKGEQNMYCIANSGEL